MTANQEIAAYLDHLLEHEASCEREDCPHCESLRNICQAVRNLMFSEVTYPQVTIARSQARERERSSASTSASSLPQAA